MNQQHSTHSGEVYFSKTTFTQALKLGSINYLPSSNETGKSGNRECWPLKSWFCLTAATNTPQHVTLKARQVVCKQLQVKIFHANYRQWQQPATCSYKVVLSAAQYTFRLFYFRLATVNNRSLTSHRIDTFLYLNPWCSHFV